MTSQFVLFVESALRLPTATFGLFKQVIAIWRSGTGSEKSADDAAAFSLADVGFETDSVSDIHEGVVVDHVSDIAKKLEDWGTRGDRWAQCVCLFSAA